MFYFKRITLNAKQGCIFFSYSHRLTMGSFSNWKNSGSFLKSTKGGEKKGKKRRGKGRVEKGKRREKTGRGEK